jgi:pimeloyl-ACP methyl ester carboxylesterase
VFEFASTLDPSSPGTIPLVAGFLTPDRYIELLTSAYAPGFEVTEDVAAGYTRVLQVEGWEAAFLAFGAQRTTTPLDYDALAAVDVPILIIWGEADTWVPLAAGERLSDLLPEAEFITYPGVGHMPMEENVATFNTDLLAFLARAAPIDMN